MSSEQVEFIDWHTEASAVITDVKDHVKTIEISEKLITGIFFIVSRSGLERFMVFLGFESF